MWRAFFDEIEKIAVSMKEIRQAAKRIRGVVRLPSHLEALGGLYAPTTKQMTSAGTKKLSDLQTAALGKETIKQMEQVLAPLYKKHPGKILSSPNVGRVLDPTIRGSRVKNLEAFVHLHEAAERAATSRPIPASLHTSPEVLIKDKNLLARLTGRGSGGVKRSIGELRQPEFDFLQQQMTKAFGPEAQKFFEPGAKIPKAMRKAFLRSGPTINPERMQSIMGEQMSIMQEKLRRAS